MPVYSNLGISEYAPFDPSQTNTWATTVNTNMTLLDNAIAGIQPVTITTADVILTANNGAPDQSRNAHFNLSGTLTGNRNLFFPATRTEMFSVYNGTSGAFSVTLAVNNGSGSPAGATLAVPQGGTGVFGSDGTNIFSRATASGLIGILPTNQGGTGADLSATGGANQVVQQTSTGAVFTVGQLGAANLSDGVTGTGAVVLATSPTLSGTIGGNLVWAGTATYSGAVTFSSAITYGGVTLANGVTGTTSMVLATSPALSGTPTAPTAASNINTTQLATTAWVYSSIQKVLTGITYKSGPQTFSAGNSAAIAHGLGVVPTTVDTYLVCSGSADGYTPGQTIFIPQGARSADAGLTVIADTSNLTYIIGTDGITLHNTGGTTVSLASSANFGVAFVARAF